MFQRPHISRARGFMPTMAAVHSMYETKFDHDHIIPIADLLSDMQDYHAQSEKMNEHAAKFYPEGSYSIENVSNQIMYANNQLFGFDSNLR